MADHIITVDPDPVATLLSALCFAWRGDIGLCDRRLARLSAGDLRAARTALLRTAARVDVVWFEQAAPDIAEVAKALLTPDCPSLPDGVDGFAVHGVHTEAVTG